MIYRLYMLLFGVILAGQTRSWAALAPNTSSAKLDSVILYVSPTGSGTAFSTCNPGSLSDAQARVRTLNAGMTQNMTVALYGGVYQLRQPIMFTDVDGGKNGFKVVYKPVSVKDTPVLEGGQPITGWQQFNGTLWVADASSVVDCRQFWINGNRRQRASSEKSYPVSLWRDANQHVIGVVAAPGTVAAYGNLQDVELQFVHYWRNTHLPITSVTDNGNGVNVKINLDNASYTYGPVDESSTYHVVNAFELLDQPGEWYFNRTTKKIYYYPLPTEDLFKADAYVGVLDRIVDFRGASLAKKVQNIRLENLTMRHNTWLDPNTAVWGYSPLQGETLYYYDSTIAAPHMWYRYMPGTIVATRTRGIELVNNRIVQSGGGGVMLLGQGVDSTLIEGNVIQDMSGAGIVVSNHFQQMIDEGRIVKDNLFADVADNVPPGLEAPCVGTLIRNNYLNALSVEYQASTGVQLYYPALTNMGYNELSAMSYTGISLGWGWAGPVAVPVTQYNRLHHNRVSDYMKVLMDGGAIYTNGNQTASEIDSNYIFNQDAQSWRLGDSGSLYPDEGSQHVAFHDNVLQNIHKWLHIWTTSIANNSFTRNFSTTANAINAGDATNTFANNQLGISPLPASAQVLIDKSGLQPAFQYLRTRQTNPSVYSSFDQGLCLDCTRSSCLRVTYKRIY